MKVPKSFKLFGTTVNISFDNETTSNQSVLGECSFSRCSITLSDVHKGEKLPNDTILDTFYHEKIHMILDAIGEHELSGNEKFVETFSRLLRQSDETTKY